MASSSSSAFILLAARRAITPIVIRKASFLVGKELFAEPRQRRNAHPTSITLSKLRCNTRVITRRHRRRLTAATLPSRLSSAASRLSSAASSLSNAASRSPSKSSSSPSELSLSLNFPTACVTSLIRRTAALKLVVAIGLREPKKAFSALLDCGIREDNRIHRRKRSANCFEYYI